MSDLIRIPGSRIVEVSRLAFGRPDVALLCFGESDQPSPPVAHDAAVAALHAGETRYSDVRGLPELRHALADYLTGLHARPVAEDRVQVTASGMTAVAVALSAILRPGDRIVMHMPLWPNLPNAARLRGARVDEVALDAAGNGGFRLDLERLAQKLPGARALVLNTPNNPTGWTATAAELETILALCRRHGVWLVSDEVYSRLVYDGAAAAPSLLDVADPEDRVVVCNSFSKTWVMTGWRLGWMVLPADARDAVSEIVEVTHSGVAPFIQRAGVAALADAGSVELFRAHCARGRDVASAALAGLSGVRYAAPEGAFYAFIGVEGVSDSLALAKRLVTEHGVALAPGSAFGAAGEGSLRLCFAQSEAVLQRAAERLRAGLRAMVAAQAHGFVK
ncbi:MAG: pyridoxal phosphate-dependent aminotransferase [Acetobacteraceae bacterium]|nr:pyridoxal phosphate-dependent aminotransferase [Acetobacteraceae bacterium]